MFRWMCACFVPLLLVFPSVIWAIEDEQPRAFKQTDTSSPRATLQTFIESCNKFHNIVESSRVVDRRSLSQRNVVVSILECLDLSEVPEYAREEVSQEAAVCIKEIIDRIPIPPYSEIPDMAAIEAAGGSSKLPRWRIPNSPLVIAKITDGPRQYEYLFTSLTVDRVIDYYEEIQDLPYRTTGPEISKDLYYWFTTTPGNPMVAKIVDGLPNMLRERSFGMANWKWVGICISALAAVTLMVFVYSLQWQFERRWRETALFKYWLSYTLPIIALLIPMGFQYFAEHDLTIRGFPLLVLTFVSNLLVIFAIIVLIFGLGGRIAGSIISSPKINPRGLNAQFIRVTAKLLCILASVIMILEGGQYLGIPISTLLASAGVGGLAIALSSQHALKSIFGTIMLMADRPFYVGDRIIVDEYDGVVESVGLRSTRLRLLTGHQVTIPNDILAAKDVENVGSRPHIRKEASIHIHLDTPKEKIEKALEIIRDALHEHEGMDPEFPPRVNFNEIKQECLNIRFVFWYNPPDYWKSESFAESLNVRICDAFQAQGIRFAPIYERGMLPKMPTSKE